MLLKCLLEYTNKNKSGITIRFSRNKAFKTLKLEFSGSVQIHITVHTTNLRVESYRIGAS